MMNPEWEENVWRIEYACNLHGKNKFQGKLIVHKFKPVSMQNNNSWKTCFNTNIIIED